MDTLFIIIMVILSGILLVGIAVPEKILPSVPNKKKKKVGSSYWGVYEEADPTQSVGEIEVQPLAGKQKTVYGATTYALGRGVSRRGA